MKRKAFLKQLAELSKKAQSSSDPCVSGSSIVLDGLLGAFMAGDDLVNFFIGSNGQLIKDMRILLEFELQQTKQ